MTFFNVALVQSLIANYGYAAVFVPSEGSTFTSFPAELVGHLSDAHNEGARLNYFIQIEGDQPSFLTTGGKVRRSRPVSSVR